MASGRSAAGRGEAAERGWLIAHYGVAVLVRMDSGERRRVRVKRSSGHVVGDRVEIGARGLARLPRRGVLKRRDSHGRIRSVAANLDILGIVVAPLPASPMGFVDRALVAASTADLQPLLIVNKLDCDGARALAAELARIYGDTLRCALVSAETGEGMGELAAHFAPDRRGVFIGTSGVGKSSILNALCPDLELEVGEINEVSGLGRHITTTATMHCLPGGGELIDTPGFRDFGPVAIGPSALATAFPGFEEPLATGCRFRDCQHRGEPDCAVLAAVAAGRVPQERHAAYLDLLAELERSEGEDRGY